MVEAKGEPEVNGARSNGGEPTSGAEPRRFEDEVLWAAREAAVSAVRRAGASVEDAEDSASEAVTRVLAADDVEKIQNPVGYGVAIAKNFYRRSRRPNTPPVGLTERWDTRDPLEHVLEREEWAAAREALSRVGGPDRLLLWLQYIDEVPIRRIAELTNRSPGAAKQALYNARKRLRRKFHEILGSVAVMLRRPASASVRAEVAQLVSVLLVIAGGSPGAAPKRAVEPSPPSAVAAMAPRPPHVVADRAVAPARRREQAGPVVPGSAPASTPRTTRVTHQWTQTFRGTHRSDCAPVAGDAGRAGRGTMKCTLSGHSDDCTAGGLREHSCVLTFRNVVIDVSVVAAGVRAASATTCRAADQSPVEDRADRRDVLEVGELRWPPSSTKTSVSVAPTGTAAAVATWDVEVLVQRYATRDRVLVPLPETVTAELAVTTPCSPGVHALPFTGTLRYWREVR